VPTNPRPTTDVVAPRPRRGRSLCPAPGVNPRWRLLTLLLTLAWATTHTSTLAQAPERWDTFSDTWTATDALGRSLPSYEEVGPPRPDRTVALFYFLWHGEHVRGGPYDITKILHQDAGAMTNAANPLWGPMHAPHHWGESIFGYYLTDDAGVLRKHAQMLADAGVDAIFFDVSNQLTYPKYYRALLQTFAERRRQGGHPPRIAFLCPFWEPAKVVAELYRELYQPRLFSELWFYWDGKPLLLADPRKLGNIVTFKAQNGAVRLQPGHRLGQSFQVDDAWSAVAGCFPTWAERHSGMTLTLRSNGPAGPALLSRRFDDVGDNSWLALTSSTPLPAGTYYLETSDPRGPIGWWTHSEDRMPGGQAYVDGQPVAGDRNLQLTRIEPRFAEIMSSLTFRRPQPDYFQGQSMPDEWSWLEVYPQHVFTNAAGQREQMSVGVAQNAVSNRLGSMSEPGALGRSFQPGVKTRLDAPRQGLQGLNVAAQWAHAQREDPRLIFITGWNEWIAGRFDEFNHIRQPVMFVDQFDQEHSRDIEPMRGGHEDSYYYQMAANIRRYKDVRPAPRARPQLIRLDGRFEDWSAVEPEFRDDIGDPVERDHPGWGQAPRYVNHTGRNDIIAAKVSWDATNLYFYVRTRAALSFPRDTNWMLLFLDIDHNPTNGWLGYDFVVGRHESDVQTVSLEKHQPMGFRWAVAARVQRAMGERELEMAIPRSALAMRGRSVSLSFKWADNAIQTGDWSDLTLNGDVAPNARYRYQIHLEESE